MSLKMKSLGTVSSAARGILITGGTNAAPIVATVTAGHRLKNNDRIAIAGVTTLTSMNGEWTIERATDTTYKLLGSSGNGAFAGTAVVSAVCDRSPFHYGHSAVLAAGDLGVAAVFVGTLLCEGADSIDATQHYYTNSAGVATAGFKDMLLTGEIAIPAQTVVGGGTCLVEVKTARYMTLRCSAYTSGTAYGALLG